MPTPMPIGSVLDIPGHGKFLVVGHGPDGKEQLKYVGSPTKPKAVKGWTPPSVNSGAKTPATGQGFARRRPRQAQSTNRSGDAGPAPAGQATRRQKRYCPVYQEKQSNAAGWTVTVVMLLLAAIIGACNDIQSRKLPDFITSHHGR